MANYKAGDTIKGYRLLEDFRIANGGNCEWTFAERSGQQHFIKVLFSPKYPAKPMGSPATIEKKRQACADFERHQRQLMAKAGAVAGVGGRLVVPTELFRVDAFYYKVSPKVDAVPLSVAEIAAQPLGQKLYVMMTVSSAIRALHAAGIVHGDLSPANILISAKGEGFVANVIDFDSSYLDKDPPPANLLMGNPPYYSPELLAYTVDGAAGTALTTQSDIFALGLVYWQYAFGQLPAPQAPHNYAAEAVAAGLRLAPPPLRDGAGLTDLITAMLVPDPTARPTMKDVQAHLKKLQRPGGTAPGTLGSGVPTVTETGPSSPVSPGGGLKRPTRRKDRTEPVPAPTGSRVKFRKRSPS